MAPSRRTGPRLKPSTTSGWSCTPTVRASSEDKAEAVRWWLQAAEQGLAEAQYNLGVAYDTGEGVLRDDAEAARWYRMAVRAERRRRAVKPWEHVRQR